jgi:parvulin-like peptidyl-prolyl isomerase
MHYYVEQQKLSFDSESGRGQLNEFKKRALDRVVNDAYIKRVAKQNNIVVTEQEVSAEIEILRNQDRLGETEKVFEDVLKDYWGWSIDDFRRSVKQQILNQKVLAFWDTETRQRADVALAELRSGKDFAEVAKQYSDDVATKEQGGDLGVWVDQINRDISAKTIAALFAMQPGQTSEIIDIGYALEIVKLIETKDGKAHAAHIVFSYKDINQFLNDEKDKQKAQVYIKTQ